ncbi:uncharacterized protein LOC132753971, partial [Ruditapes philippinarum]|uniref:uncharacterized protein LOC132753971 n=1 Tax=Ruditapes philippinarum TaxID=129788 RepID=UPI00295ACAF1
MNKFSVPNALAEVVLLLGVDENTGLVPVPDSADVNIFDALFELKYEAKVLSAISGTDMLTFYPIAQRVETYPPRNTQELYEQHTEEMMKIRDRKMSEFNMNFKKSFQNAEASPSRTTRSISLSPKMSLARSMSIMTVTRPRFGGSSNNALPELPISDEA